MNSNFNNRLFLFLSLFLIGVSSIEAQTLSSQAEVDAFDPVITEITGNLTISGDDIVNIDALINVTNVSGRLIIEDNEGLLNIDGLSNITSISTLIGLIDISNNSALEDIDGLNNLSNLEGELIIEDNNALANIDGLENLTSVGGDLEILGNDALTNVNGLSNITSISDVLGMIAIRGNEVLTNVDGLINLSNITGELILDYNFILNNIDGLGGLQDIIGTLTISNNGLLNDVDGLSNLTDVTGTLEVFGSFMNIDGLNNLNDIVGTLDIKTHYLTNIDGLSNLTEISGELKIRRNSELENIDALSNLTDIKGTLFIESNGKLLHIDGLSNLTEITGRLDLWSNDSLTNIDALNNLTDVIGKFSLSGNNALININGLLNIIDISGELDLYSNNSLTNIDGLMNLTDVSGSLEIDGHDSLVNINGLLNLTDISGFFMLGGFSNDMLTNIDGLFNLEDISGTVEISQNDSLTNIDGLINLVNLSGTLIIGGFSGCPSLTNIDGLLGLTDVSGLLEISNNDVLTNIDGLSNLDDISGTVIIGGFWGSPALTNIDGLINLDDITGVLEIVNNDALTNIDGLSNLTEITGELEVARNESLSNCCGLYTVLLFEEYDNVYIGSNSSMCQSIQEILDSDCGVTLLYETNSPCIGIDNGSIQLTAINFDTIPFNYSWEHEQSNATGAFTTYDQTYILDDLASGSYNVTLTQPNGEVAKAQNIFLDPILGSSFEIMELTTVNSVNGLSTGSISMEYDGGNAPYTISWSGIASGSTSNISVDNFTISDLLPGDYAIIIIDTNGSELSLEVNVLDDNLAAVECESPMDIVVLNLVSGAINADEYNKSQLFFHDFFETINLGDNSTNSRASIIEWSGNNQQEIKIPLTGSLSELSGYADQERCYSGNTNILEALEYGSNYLRANARVDAEKVIIFTFDGCPPFAASAYAEELKEEGFIIADIGIDYVNNSSSYRSLLTQAASISELAFFAPNFDELDPAILYSRLSYLFCEGSSSNAYFSRDGSIEINSISTQDECPYPSYIDLTFTIEAHLQLSLPSGTPVTFYHNDPRLFGSTAISTFIIPCSIPVGTSEVFTITLLLEKATHLYAVLNDDGLTNPAFELPVTDIIESQYSNNIASQQICVDGFATLQSFKSSTSLLPICEGIAQYTIDVCNVSNVDAIDVSIEDDAATGFVLLNTITNDNGCSIEEGGVYDIPAGCCVSLTLDYDISSANDGHYRNQNVYLSGPVEQIYLDFDGENTTSEDIILNGEENCGSNIVLFTKEVDNDTTCEDHSLSYTFTIDNQTSNNLIGLEFSDVLPEPLQWVYKPYSKEGLSITTSSILDQSATFMLDEIQAETTASFVIDVYVGATDEDVISSSFATISGLPAYINDGSQVVVSNAPTTVLLADIEIDIADTIYVPASANTISLEANLSDALGIFWTTSGGGFFSDPYSSNPTYQLGLEDTFDSLFTFFVEVSTYCGQKGESVIIKRICDLEFSDDDLNICLSDVNGADAIITWEGGAGPYRLDEDWSDESIISPYTIADVIAGNYTITLLDTLGCTDQLTLTVSDIPQASIETNCISSEAYFIEIVSGEYDITVDNGYETEYLGDSVYQINNIDIGTTLSITIVDTVSGCDTTLVVAPPVCATATQDNDFVKMKDLLVPNIISLQSGGNNIFYPTIMDSNQLIIAMRIYDRFGHLVFNNENFTANTPGEGWDGMDNGTSIQSGVYMYLIQTKSKVYTGDVTVIR